MIRLESILLAFSQGHTPQRGFAFLLGLIVLRTNVDFAFQRRLLHAYRSGRHTDDLLFAEWEELLPLPLDEVRRELGVEVLA